MSWELTDEEILAALFSAISNTDYPWGGELDEQLRYRDRAIANAATKEVLRVLSEQCGDDPCKGCKGRPPKPSITTPCLWFASPSQCGKYAHYLGQLAQAAKGQQLLQEIKDEINRQATEVNENLIQAQDEHFCPNNTKNYWIGVQKTLEGLYQWLQERGKHE